MTQQSTYLLEIGTEELPASFLESAPPELKARMQEALQKALISHGEIQVLQTPRRLALFVHNMAAQQSPSQELLKGPPVSVGLDASGKPTPAAHGFAKKNGIRADQLQRQEIDGAEYLVYHKHSPGRPVSEVLPEIIPDVVLGLSGSHFMAWDASDIKFSRPIRWLLSMLDDKPLPVKIGLIQSGTETRGHRFFAATPGPIAIKSVADYKTQLWQAGHVMVDPAERRAAIVAGLEQAGKDYKGHVPQDQDLLHTVTMLVESPALVTGSFPERFLSLPKEVITTVMAAHQKYFPVENTQGQLMPYFITISNNTREAAFPTIREGNERVLRARLEDASFFFQEDTKHPLGHYVDSLSGITFQKGLGSLLDKTTRLKALVKALAPLTGLGGKDVELAEKAATLCKADLATNMVRELTELQGIVGRHYARLSGENDAVAEAIAEHYLPRFTGDAVAASPVGITLSLADKLDTLLAVFAQKDARYPTGSKDPMGLRRMAMGILQTVLENKLSFDLDAAMAAAYGTLGSLAVEPEDRAVDRTRQFLLQRLKGLLLDQQFSYDTIDAVLDADVSPLADLNRTLERLHLLKGLQQNADTLKTVYEPANRTSRILGKAYVAGVTAAAVNPSLFEDEAERELFAILQQHPLTPETPLTQYLALFGQWAPAVENFFNKVLVNAEKTAVKDNRYALLSLLNGYFRQFADFTKLVV